MESLTLELRGYTLITSCLFYSKPIVVVYKENDKGSMFWPRMCVPV